MSKFFDKINLTPKQLLNIILLIVLIAFIGQNIDSVPINFLIWTFNLPLIIIILITFFIGFFTKAVFTNRKRLPKAYSKDAEKPVTAEK